MREEIFRKKGKGQKLLVDYVNYRRIENKFKVRGVAIYNRRNRHHFLSYLFWSTINHS